MLVSELHIFSYIARAVKSFSKQFTIWARKILTEFVSIFFSLVCLANINDSGLGIGKLRLENRRQNTGLVTECDQQMAVLGPVICCGIRSK